MPMYQYHCPICSGDFEELARIEERHSVLCQICLVPAELKVAGFNRGYDFENEWFEHFPNDKGDGKGMVFKNKKHLREECKKRGVWAKCLD